MLFRRREENRIELLKSTQTDPIQLLSREENRKKERDFLIYSQVLCAETKVKEKRVEKGYR